MPRNSRLDSQLIEKILSALRDGKNVREMCSEVEISRAAFYKWLEAGERGVIPYAQFYTAVCNATAIGDQKRLSDVLATLGLAPVA